MPDIRSMSAFARCSDETELGNFTWEIRAVNHRYLELHFRLPDSLRDLEPKLREALKANFGRGKMEIALRYQAPDNAQSLVVDEELVRQINHAADQIHAIIGPGNALSSLEILNMPGVMKTGSVDGKAVQKQALSLFDNAIRQLKDTRQREGEELGKLIQQRLDAIKPIVAQVREQMPQALAQQKQNLQDKLNELAAQLDNDRLEQEIVLLAQKADVAEELDRLDTHVQEVARILTQNEPIGRRLDFMMQELNREANTLSSKSLTTNITKAAVDLKVLIEQMREQIQNIE